MVEGVLRARDGVGEHVVRLKSGIGESLSDVEKDDTNQLICCQLS